MATIQAEVSKYHKKKDGTIPVKIRITHKQKMRRLPTNLVAYPEDLTREYKIKGNLKRRCDELVKTMYDAMNDISYFDVEACDVDFIVAHIKTKLEKVDWHLDYFQFADEFLQTTKISESTKRSYRVALSALERFVGRRELEINDITNLFLENFSEFLANEPKYYYFKKEGKTVKTKKSKRRGAGDRVYFSKLATIFKAAKLRYNDEELNDIRIPRSPFDKIRIQASPSEGQEPLPVELIRIMIRETNPIPQSERNAIDLFIVSLGLMGANMVDLYAAEPPGKYWRYHRTKTRTRRADGAEMRASVPDCLAPYIDRLTVGAERGRWLNLSRRFQNANYATKTTNDALKSWARRHGVPEFTFYAARKSWATIASTKECGIDKALVDECLAHVGDFKIANIYIKRDWERLWAANNKVCDFIFQNP